MQSHPLRMHAKYVSYPNVVSNALKMLYVCLFVCSMEISSKYLELHALG